MNPTTGQIYRDTTFDKHERTARLRHRTIRLLERLEDGRWQVETLTDYDGSTRDKPRKTKVSEKTLTSGYVLLPSTRTD